MILAEFFDTRAIELKLRHAINKRATRAVKTHGTPGLCGQLAMMMTTVMNDDDVADDGAFVMMMMTSSAHELLDSAVGFMRVSGS